MSHYADLIEAQNPETSPEQLAELGRHANPLVLEAVVRNPSTPLGSLKVLGVHFSQGLLQNPALSAFTHRDFSPHLSVILRSFPGFETMFPNFGFGVDDVHVRWFFATLPDAPEHVLVALT